MGVLRDFPRDSPGVTFSKVFTGLPSEFLCGLGFPRDSFYDLLGLPYIEITKGFPSGFLGVPLGTFLGTGDCFIAFVFFKSGTLVFQWYPKDFLSFPLLEQ